MKTVEDIAREYTDGIMWCDDSEQRLETERLADMMREAVADERRRCIAGLSATRQSWGEAAAAWLRAGK